MDRDHPFNIKIEVDEYLETMYNLNKRGWFITKATEKQDRWAYEIMDRDKNKKKLFVMKPVS